jgi:transcriptional regulator with XRE-family HTH domain
MLTRRDPQQSVGRSDEGSGSATGATSTAPATAVVRVHARATGFPMRESAQHPTSHRRRFCASRLKPARAAAGLTRSRVAEQLREHATDQEVDERGCDPRRLALLEAGVMQPEAWELIALASIYGVSLEAFVECDDCFMRDHERPTSRTSAAIAGQRRRT